MCLQNKDKREAERLDPGVDKVWKPVEAYVEEDKRGCSLDEAIKRMEAEKGKYRMEAEMAKAVTGGLLVKHHQPAP